MKKTIGLDSSVDEKNKKKKKRKRKNKENTDEISQGLLIKPKKTKKIAAKKSQIFLTETEPKKEVKSKSKGRN